MLNINDYESRKSYIETLANSVDFSKVRYNREKDIDFSIFNLSELPEVNYKDADDRIEKVFALLDKVNASLKSSRLSAEKKENIKNALVYIIEDIGSYKELSSEDYLENKKYDKLNLIKNRIMDLSTKAPMSMREELSYFGKSLESRLKDLYKNISNRSYLINRLSEVLVERSREFYTEEYKKELENKNLTLEDIKNFNQDEQVTAACIKVNEQFGSGASSLLRTLIHTKENDLPMLSWTQDEYIKGIVDFAKSLGLKEIGFEGNSTAVLGNLNIITKMGLSFKIIEIEKKNYFENTIIPIVVVQL